MTRILQITDTHILKSGALAYGRVDTARALREAIAHLERQLPLIAPVDYVIVTGDLTDFGEPEEYQLFKDIMSDMNLPYAVIPGNHDQRENLRAAFRYEPWMPAKGEINWRMDFTDYTLLALDSLEEGWGRGTLSKPTLAWLSQQLKELQDTPILLALHHPPAAHGIVPMDKMGLTNSKEFFEVLKSHQSSLRIICGHVHRHIVMESYGRIVECAPAIPHSVALNLRNNNENGFTLEPAQALLHCYNHGFYSHTLNLTAHDGPFPFEGYVKD